jgi:probable rRNA maturation factor
MIHYQISEEFTEIFNAESVRIFAEKTLDYMGSSSSTVSVVIENNAAIQVLNRDYRHIDAPTDVLSFAYDMIDPETSNRYLGDIIISGDKVIEQANQAGHSRDKELCILIIHGILHLHGFDHETEEDEAAMFPLQEKIIKTMDLP